jgi:hypothetical protein
MIHIRFGRTYKDFCQILNVKRRNVYYIAPLDLEVGSKLTLYCFTKPLILSLLEVVG